MTELFTNFSYFQTGH